VVTVVIVIVVVVVVAVVVYSLCMIKIGALLSSQVAVWQLEADTPEPLQQVGSRSSIEEL